MFNKRGTNIPHIQIRYLGVFIKVVDAIKYLGLIFSSIREKNPNIENLALAAERARFAVQNRIILLGYWAQNLKSDSVIY